MRWNVVDRRRGAWCALAAAIALAGVPAVPPGAAAAAGPVRTGGEAPGRVVAQPAASAVTPSGAGATWRPPAGPAIGMSEMSLLWMDPVEQGRALDGIAAMGATWVRVDVPWSVVEARRGEFDWSAVDRLVFNVRVRGLRLLGLITYSPEWARPRGTRSDHWGPIDPASIAPMAAAAAARYAPVGVHHWEIWNEPNLAAFWKPQPEPMRYTRLLRAAAGAIRRADPKAVIVSGGLAPALDAMPGEMAPTTFLAYVYRHGGRSAFDAVGMHPYSFPWSVNRAADWNLFSRLPSVHAMMRAFGDGHKRIWATELGWPTGTGEHALPGDRQAARVVEAVHAWRRFAFAGPLFFYQYRDHGAQRSVIWDNFGFVRRDHWRKLAYLALDAVSGTQRGAAARGPRRLVTRLRLPAWGLSRATAAGLRWRDGCLVLVPTAIGRHGAPIRIGCAPGPRR